MQINLPEKFKKWCDYNKELFDYILKQNAPENIKKEFEQFKQDELFQKYKFAIQKLKK